MSTPLTNSRSNLRGIRELLAVQYSERRQVFLLLQKLDAARRVRFLAWACKQATRGGLVPVGITKQTGEAAEVYWDICLLCHSYGLSWRVVAERLERAVAAH